MVTDLAWLEATLLKGALAATFAHKTRHAGWWVETLPDRGYALNLNHEATFGTAFRQFCSQVEAAGGTVLTDGDSITPHRIYVAHTEGEDPHDEIYIEQTFSGETMAEALHAAWTGADLLKNAEATLVAAKAAFGDDAE